jgi:hypothetical protein
MVLFIGIFKIPEHFAVPADVLYAPCFTPSPKNREIRIYRLYIDRAVIIQIRRVQFVIALPFMDNQAFPVYKVNRGGVGGPEHYIARRKAV